MIIYGMLPNSRDYKVILELIEKINLASSSVEICKIFYEDMQKLVPFPTAITAISDTNKNEVLQEQVPLYNVPGSIHDLWLENYHQFDPVLLSLLKGVYDSKISQAFKFSDFTSPSELEDSEYGRDFMKLLPFYHAATVMLALQGDSVMIFGIHRPKTDRDFSKYEMDILNLLTPHLSIAVHNLKLRNMMASEQGIGLIVINVDGHISHINEPAADALNGRPVKVIPDPSRSNAPVYFQSERGTYRVRTMEIAERGEKVIILAPFPSEHYIKSRLSHFGLSKRETEVLILVFRGFTNKEIAERLFISEDTVRNHLRNIFMKAGVSSRAKLISNILGLNSFGCDGSMHP